MREFKFRAWDKELKKMIYEDDEECLIGYDGTELFLTRDVYWGEEIQREIADDVIFMEWTGIQDDNKKDIYEGDLVKAGESSWECEVYFSTEMQAFMLKDLNPKYQDSVNFMSQCDGYKVIGNIFENPELLKEE